MGNGDFFMRISVLCMMVVMVCWKLEFSFKVVSYVVGFGGEL